MRLLTATSIAALVVSIAVLVFVLGLYAELEKSEPKAHTQERSSEDICISADNKLAEWGRNYAGEVSDKIAFDVRLALFKIQLAHACFK